MSHPTRALTCIQSLDTYARLLSGPNSDRSSSMLNARHPPSPLLSFLLTRRTKGSKFRDASTTTGTATLAASPQSVTRS